MSDDIRKAFFRERMEAASEDASKLVNLIAEMQQDSDEGAVHERSAHEIAFADTFFGRTKFSKLFDDDYKKSDGFKACSHVSLSHPSVMFVPLCTPNLLACSMCLLEYQNDWNSKHPDDCDSCYEYADGFYEVSMPVGPLIFVGNVCDTCMSKHRESMGLGESE
jgi:hypothetical protein